MTYADDPRRSADPDQPFPVGAYVQISGGMYNGCLGVVSRPAPSRQDRTRPSVRVLADARNRLLAPFEVKLWEQPRHVELHGLPDGGIEFADGLAKAFEVVRDRRGLARS